MTIISLPLLCLNAKGAEGVPDPSDPILDVLADEIAQIAADGAREGFKAEHFGRAAALIRTFDARLEERGANRRFNLNLGDEDFHKLNPSLAAGRIARYWENHGVRIDEEDTRFRLSMDAFMYREMKKIIKTNGGIRPLHAAVVKALRRKAKECGSGAFRGGAVIANGLVVFPSSNAVGANFTRVQFEELPFDPLMFAGLNIDCLCKAMVVEGAIMSILCATAICPVCCAPAAIILGAEKLLEVMGLCSPDKC